MRGMGTYWCLSLPPGGPHHPGMVLEVKLGYTNAMDGNIPVPVVATVELALPLSAQLLIYQPLFSVRIM